MDTLEKTETEVKPSNVETPAKVDNTPTKTFSTNADPIDTKTGVEATQGLDAFAKELGELPGLSAELESKVTAEKKPELETKKEETKKEPTSTDNATIKTEDKPETKKEAVEETVKPPTEEEVKGRDFSGLEENEIPLVKRMSNAAYNYVKPALIELKIKRAEAKRLLEENASLKQGKVTLPENYNEHPNAYMLTPEFGEVSQNINTLASWQNHWEAQLLNIKQQKDWQPIVDDGKGGYALGAAQPSTPTAEMQVLKHYNHITRQLGEQEGRMKTLQTNHTSRYREAIGSVQAKEKELFGYMDDEKNPSNKTFKEIKAMFPTSVQANPLTNLAAKALAGILQYKAAYEQLAAKQTSTTKVAETIKDDATKAGPNNKTIDNGGTTKAKSPITMEAFKSAMED